ncbi:MAG TPA: SLC13 family permease [Candidatus Dormibacteraeota bacterium]
MTVTRTRLRVTLLSAGVVGAVIALLLEPSAFGDAAAHTWSPFALVAGLLLIGAVANQDGIFAAASRALGRLPAGDLALYLASMLLVAVVTVFLNLDTSVAFLTPVLVLVARSRGADVPRFLYGCVFMSNAASLLLPGSNLTNLLILSNQHQTGSAFLAQMAAPWVAAVLVTVVVVAVAFRGRGGSPIASGIESQRQSALSLGAVLVAAVLILVLANPALPVLGIGLLLAALRVSQRRVSLAHLGDIDVPSLAGVFLVALALGTLARVWSFPGHVMAGAGDVASAAIGAAGAVLVNNLPAAVLLGSRMPADPRSLLLGLNIGPNLAVTGSLSALIWWSAARSVGAKPSALRYSAVGVVLVPLTLAAGLAAGRLF